MTSQIEGHETELQTKRFFQNARDLEAMHEVLSALESLDEKLKYLDCRLSPRAMKRIDRLRKIASEQWEITFNAAVRSRKEMSS